MQPALQGIHHVTAIASDPQANLDFYTGVLGLRLVKQTVNFDDPSTYHLYYGDDTGQPGTIMTFFPYPRARQGQRGTQQITAVAFVIAPESIDFWIERLRALDVQHETPRPRFEDTVITLFDPDGLVVELVATAGAGSGTPWPGSPVAAQHALRGFHGITLAQSSTGPSANFLRDVLHFTPEAVGYDRVRFSTGGHEPQQPRQRIDLVELPNVAPGRIAAGSVHHVAFRVPDDDAQRQWHAQLSTTDAHTTEPLDRHYFRSIYFREPGGVLFEIATDAPGFTRDEDSAALGSQLKLPPWLEARRAQLDERLPPLTLPPQSAP